MVQDELFRLGEQMVHSAEGTRAIALELCREFEDKFLAHIAHGEVSHLIHYGHLQCNETSHLHDCMHLYIDWPACLHVFFLRVMIVVRHTTPVILLNKN
jgi:hypothetical protein